MAIFGLLVWAGTISPDTSENYYPGNQELVEQPQSYVGEQVTVSGVVVETEPVVIRTSSGDENIDLTLQKYDDSTEVGDYANVFGTYQGDSVVVVERSLTREQWEVYYMYIVSFIGGLWVLIRILHYWQIDRKRWSLVPRGGWDG